MEKDELIKKHGQSNNMMIAGLGLVVVAVVLLIIFFINGKTDVDGGFPDPETTISTTCTSGVINYPFFSMNEAAKKEMDIKVISNDNVVDTVSLSYRLYYDSEAAIINSRDVNHFAVNKAFEAVDMEADSLGATYSKLVDNFRFNLFAKAVKINDITKKFFLLDDIEYKDGLNYDEVKRAYEKIGFECVTDEEKD